MKFTVYDLTTGAIKRRGICIPRSVAHQAQDGEGVLETPDGIRDGDKWHVDTSKMPHTFIPKEGK